MYIWELNFSNYVWYRGTVTRFEYPPLLMHQRCASFFWTVYPMITRIKRTSLPTFVLLTAISCGRLWGDNDLGDNFSLLEGDRAEDRVIVYCSGRSAGACTGGTFIVPVYSRHIDKNGHYAEYVEAAKSNDKFIIARTIQLKEETKNYWIIYKDLNVYNCNDILCDSTEVLGPLNETEFIKKTADLSINLKFR